MASDFLETQLQRCRILLSPERVRTAFSETAPEQDPASVAAVGGLGVVMHDPEVKASIYVFESAQQERAALPLLRAQVPQGDDWRVLYTSNGHLLFLGYTNLAGPQGQTAKSRLA